MTEIIKQRLVGMLIIVIAGVVFLPDLLDGQKQLTKEEFKKVPAKPEIDQQPILTEFPSQQVSEAMLNKPVDDTKPQDLSAEEVTLESDKNTEQQSDASLTKDSVEMGEPNVVTGTIDTSIEVDENATKKLKPVNFKEPAWILQLGSFKHKENVNTLRQTLLDAGFKTFIKPVQTKSGVLSKVYLGPELDKAKLVTAQAKLKELVGLEGKITRYDPIK